MDLADLFGALPADGSPTTDDYLLCFDVNTGLPKKVLMPNVVSLVAILKTLADAKGDLVVASAADAVGRLPVGSNGQILYADSGQTLGIKWDSPPSGSGITAGIMDAKGDLIVATANDTPVRKAVGANGKQLTADSAQSDGLVWQDKSDRVTSEASNATPTPNGGLDDTMHCLTALATNPTFQAPSGSPGKGFQIIIRIKDNGSARTLAWNSIYRSVVGTLPTTTVASKTTYVGLKYNSADSKWDCLAVGTEA